MEENGISKSVMVHLQDKIESASVASFRSAQMSSSQEIDETKIEKKRRFFDFFTMVLSIAYGIFIMIFSVGAYSSDLVFDKAYESNNSDIWNLWLSSVGIILLIWLIVDIEIYIRKINKRGKGSSF